MATNLYFVYILYSDSADTFYVGQTDDPDRRLIEHNDPDRGRFTSPYLPWKIVALFSFETRSEAIQIERYIKRQKRRSFLEWLIDHEDAQAFLISKLAG